MAIERITGGSKTDERGTVRFVNDFDMAAVRRFYVVENANGCPFRGWVAHRVERKWFTCLAGSFILHFVPIDNPDHLPSDLAVESFAMEADKPSILVVPGGYAIGIETCSEGAKLVVFSDRLLGELSGDTWRWPKEQWAIKPQGV